MPRSPQLAGSVVAITGGAGGIGAATARAFATAGASVALGDLDLEGAQRAVSGLPRGAGGRAIAARLEVSDPASMESFLDTVEAQLGPVDVMVNNAGVMNLTTFVAEDAASIRRHVDVNLLGVLFGTQAAVRRMVPRARGTVVNIASIAGVAPIPAAATYTATKHAVVGLTDTLRMEMRGSGLRFTTVLPGHVRTAMTRAIPENPVMPAVEPEQVADAIVRAVLDGDDEVFVPRRMALLRTGRALLPFSVLALLTRAVKADKQLMQAAAT